MTTEENHRSPLSREVAHLEAQAGSHAHHPQVHLQLFEQLKQRNVVRVAALYLAVCWLILDPVHVVFHMLDVPAWANHLVVIVMALGFPVVLIFAWAYEITPQGLKPTAELPDGQSIRHHTRRRLDRAIIAVLAVALAYFVFDKFWLSKHLTAAQPAAVAAENTAGRARTTAAPSFAPPAHSIGVLPFLNISGDKEQEYFSDGLTEELLNSLARINELQVAARTSAFSFKGTTDDIGTIAHKLNVGAVLEGSVRRSGNTVRITAQLINAVTGFHLWSQTYDRNLGDVLRLQTEIANAVAGALKITLLGDLAAKIELGGTRNPAAFDAYLRASKIESAAQDVEGFRDAAGAYTQAIRLDSGYALAFAGRADSLVFAAGRDTLPSSSARELEQAQADARQAIALAPELAEGHQALARCFDALLNFAPANAEYERAVALAPGNAPVLRGYARFGVKMGRVAAGIAAAQRAVVLDPLNLHSHWELAVSLYFARSYDEAIAAFNDALTLNPNYVAGYGMRGLAYYAHGDLQNARTSCELKIHWTSEQCLAVTYRRLGRRADAESQLEKMKLSLGDAAAYQYAEIYAQWSNTAKALEWLQTALRLRDTGLANLKADPLLDPLRKEPRFLALEKALNFPP